MNNRQIASWWRGGRRETDQDVRCASLLQAVSNPKAIDLHLKHEEKEKKEEERREEEERSASDREPIKGWREVEAKGSREREEKKEREKGISREILDYEKNQKAASLG